MCRIKRIDDFLAEWPDAEWGPAHIVLSDANIEDGDLDGVLENWDKYLKFDSTVMPAYDPDDPDYDPAMIEATKAFIREFRALPYDQRLQPGDRFCGEPD